MIYTSEQRATIDKLSAVVGAAKRETWALLIIVKRGFDGGVHTQVVSGYRTKEAAASAASYINEVDEGGYIKAVVFPAPQTP